MQQQQWMFIDVRTLLPMANPMSRDMAKCSKIRFGIFNRWLGISSHLIYLACLNFIGIFWSWAMDRGSFSGTVVKSWKLSFFDSFVAFCCLPCMRVDPFVWGSMYLYDVIWLVWDWLVTESARDGIGICVRVDVFVWRYLTRMRLISDGIGWVANSTRSYFATKNHESSPDRGAESLKHDMGWGDFFTGHPVTSVWSPFIGEKSLGDLGWRKWNHQSPVTMLVTGDFFLVTRLLFWSPGFGHRLRLRWPKK